MAGLATHLHYHEPSNYVLVSFLQRGLFHDLCQPGADGKAIYNEIKLANSPFQAGSQAVVNGRNGRAVGRGGGLPQPLSQFSFPFPFLAVISASLSCPTVFKFNVE